MRLLSEVLAAAQGAAGPMRPYLYRVDELRARVSAATDTPLYVAMRDAAPPRRVGGLTWRLDVVDYAGIDLPTGEIGRSVGHWNPREQLELFEVVRGSVFIVHQAPGDPQPSVVDCRAGDVLALFPGSWHLTYAANGRSRVANIYSVPAAGDESPDKYFGAAPVRLGLRRAGTGAAFFGELGIAPRLAGPTPRAALSMENVTLESAFAQSDLEGIARALTALAAP